MDRVGLRELKNRLSHYVRRARAGHSVQVTDRGEVVAELVPSVRSVPSVDVQRRLAELARRGLVRVGATNHPRLYPRLSRLVPAGTAKRLLDAERGER